MFIMQAGAYQVKTEQPDSEIIKDYEVAVCSEVIVTYVIEKER